MMRRESDKAYMQWLYQAVGMGNRGLLKMLCAASTPEEIYQMARQGCLQDRMSSKYRAKAIILEESAACYDPPAEYEKMIDRGVSFVSVGEEGYPRRLLNVPDAPFALYYAGKLPRDDEVTVAVIGARNCSAYGKAMARQFGETLAREGVQIVSGMARGIDGIGQQAALDAGGYSLGVLGCGVDICYPPENQPLYEQLIAQGGICSEYPLGIEPRAVLFPPRNRIISGLCDSVLVIEAKERSGTLITVDMALEQGREVYALPGRITDPLSGGCNRLIRQGASPALSPQDLLCELKPNCTAMSGQQPFPKSGGVRGQQSFQEPEGVHGQQLFQEPRDVRGRLLKLLDYQPESAEALQQQYTDTYDSSLTIPELYLELLQMCADGLAEKIGGNYYVRKI